MTNRLFVTRNRPVHTYAELWHASQCVLQAGLKNPEGSAWQFLSSAIITAFTFEAYLNHIGPTIFDDWERRERFPLWSKFKDIRQALGVKFHNGKGTRPLKTIDELFKFRDSLAHGRSLELSIEKYQSVHEFEKEQSKLTESYPRTAWEELVGTSTFAELVRTDVESVIRALDAERKDNDDILFNSGIGFGSAKLDSPSSV